MPTGYTADVADGTTTDLKTFAMKLARGMGALLPMRDDPLDAPVPEKFEPSTYNKDKLIEVKAERLRVIALEGSELEAEYDAAWNEASKRKSDALDTHIAQSVRYRAMIKQVEGWLGAPEGIKEFGLEQLRRGLEFDCREPFKYYGETLPGNAYEWKDQKLAQLKKDIEYHAKAYAEECERTASRNVWLEQLQESLT